MLAKWYNFQILISKLSINLSFKNWMGDRFQYIINYIFKQLMIAQCTIQVKHQFPFSIIEWETIFKDFEKVCFPIINAFKNNSIFNFYFTFKQYASLYWMVKCFSFLFLILTYMQGNFDCLVSQWFHSLLINQPDLLIPLKQGHNEICHIADVMSTHCSF